MLPYNDNPMDYWSGFFTSRQASKKQVRDAQANLHASSKLYALKVLDQKTTDTEIKYMLWAKENLLD